MFDGRIKKIIDFLKEKLTEETESSRAMLKTYSDYLKGEATEDDLEKANKQLNEILKGSQFRINGCYSFCTFDNPYDREICKET